MLQSAGNGKAGVLEAFHTAITIRNVSCTATGEDRRSAGSDHGSFVSRRSHSSAPSSVSGGDPSRDANIAADLGIFAAATTTAIVLWLCLGHYTRREHVTGTLVPQAGLLNVAARASGAVTHVYVDVGTRVRVGAPLVTISGDRNSAAMGDTDAVVAAKLRAQEAQTRATLQDLPTQAASQLKDLRTRIAMLREQVTQVNGQLLLQREEAASAEQLFEKAGPVHDKGDISTIEYDQLRDTALNDRAGIKQLQGQRLGTEQQLSSLEALLTQLPLVTATTAHQLRSQLAQLDAQLAQNEVDRDSVLRAASAGVVSSLLVKAGQAVIAGQPLLTILPQGSRLQAQLLVPSSAIGFVHDGTPVLLHYLAFPYQKFGVKRGTVVEVSRNALSPAEVTTLLGETPPRMPMYRVEVKLAAQTIDAYGKQQALLPGMALDADLLLDRRRMIEWVFEPLYGMAKRGGGHA